MLIIPISDDNPRYTTPFVNYTLLALNVLVFVLVLASGHSEAVVREYGMKPNRFHREPITLITSQFLHGGFLHILFNMWLLWIVGDNVEDALGHGWYLGVYLAGGVAADLVHAAFTPAAGGAVPTIGASGAISAVVGFYLVVFPHNRIRLFYWLWYFIGTFWARAIWVIGIMYAMEVLYAVVSAGSGQLTGVAHWAHMGGFAFGAGLALVLKRLRPSLDPHRRHVARREAARGRGTGSPTVGRGGPWRGRPAAGPGDVSVRLGPARDRARPGAGEGVSLDLFDTPEDLERAVDGRLTNGDILGAQRAFASYARAHPSRPMRPAVQLRLVQALEGMHRHEEAAACLEQFLHAQPKDVNAPEASLALGLIYGRHLGRPDLARSLLRRVANRHPNRDRANLARRELDALR